MRNCYKIKISLFFLICDKISKIHFVAEGLLLVAGDELKIKMKNLNFYF